MAKIARTKYIVRQPIKDLQGTILGYEIRYTGENYGYNEETGQDFMAAETIYNFLTQELHDLHHQPADEEYAEAVRSGGPGDRGV